MKNPFIKASVVLTILITTTFLVQETNLAPKNAQLEEESLLEKTPKEEKLILLNKNILQGEVLIIEVVGEIKDVTWKDQEIYFANINNKKIAVIGIDTREPQGEKTLIYKTSTTTTTTKELKFNFVKKDYQITKITIPEKLAKEGVTSNKLVESIAKNDNVTLKDIIEHKTKSYYFQEKFVEPLDSWINIGAFGNIRQDKYGAIRHLGVDLDGKTGDSIYATNTGIVVYANTLKNYGNVVVIEHGFGIYSLYLHMSKIKTRVGSRVEAKEKIGEVGNTGSYTLGPHLHFSIKIDGESVNPQKFIEEINKILETKSSL